MISLKLKPEGQSALSSMRMRIWCASEYLRLEEVYEKAAEKDLYLKKMKLQSSKTSVATDGNLTTA